MKVKFVATEFRRLCMLLVVLASPTAMATVFDSSPRRHLTLEEERAFGAVNMIVCPLRDAYLQATSPLIGTRDVAITAAHLFYNEKTHNKELTPKDCFYIVYDENHQVIDHLKITVIRSRWADNNCFGDHTQDFAILKLERLAKTKAPPLQIETHAVFRGAQIHMVGFHYDLDSGTRRILSDGAIYNSIRSIKKSKSTFVVHSASGANESSGAPLIDKKSGAVVALNTGYWVAECQETSSTFDVRKNYNRGVTFDARFIQDLNALRSDGVLLTHDYGATTRLPCVIVRCAARLGLRVFLVNRRH